ncbi:MULTISPECIES: cytidine deaminase [Legionella]|uniref:Cytidine deaminase n=1 Tax=Legionella septentrionalis TaxID=2498109 RepID=A0A3S0V623_9GAMM|nr:MULTISPECIES: cytidine deaminase [Legionella]MCP0913504.1 cytidine deaminase [Legionella sp. 27cVA30]RUQ89721.1 cytidine deaminase [Legionella septentrionalis]RUQ99734.1 cytidine deaminase [Legionella septentrionalis]RUR11072.1 cytidine deaminase [Legionella septentrionalis]RUR15234.1 cytidine deaminase [Legionella septentrionalis]
MNDIIKAMIKAASHALQHAYAPYSKFAVGSSLQSEDGSIFTGVNVENGSYGLTVCAETSAICQMIAAGQRKIKNMVILAKNNKLCPPCGACRQRIYEFCEPETRVYLCDQQTVLKALTVNELLPLAFSLNPPDRKKL